MVNRLELSGTIGAKPAIDWEQGLLRLVLNFDRNVIRVHMPMDDADLAIAISAIVRGDESTVSGRVTGSIHGIYCIADKIVTKSGWKHENTSKMS